MFFHVTKTDHGESFEFIPRVPQSAFINKEGNIPRVCVCPSVFQCLRAIISNKKLYSMDVILDCPVDKDTGFRKPPVVYMTGEDQKPYLPPNVSDFRTNDEHWFLSPVILKRIGYVDLVELTKGLVVITNQGKPVIHDLLAGHKKDVLISQAKNIRFGKYSITDIELIPR